MASYHRVLKTFERSIEDKSLECDHDIDSWDLLIDGQRWPGKIRLVGFIDVFFLICYSGSSHFENGIIIYKDDDAILRNLNDAVFSPDDIEKFAIKERIKDKTIAAKQKQKFFAFIDDNAALDYTIFAPGHPVAIRTTYPKSSLKVHEIKIRRNKSPIIRRRICRGLDHHSLTDLMLDVVRLGIVSHAELTAHLVSNTLAGTATDDAFRRYMGALGGGKSPGS